MPGMRPDHFESIFVILQLDKPASWKARGARGCLVTKLLHYIGQCILKNCKSHHFHGARQDRYSLPMSVCVCSLLLWMCDTRTRWKALSLMHMGGYHWSDLDNCPYLQSEGPLGDVRWWSGSISVHRAVLHCVASVVLSLGSHSSVVDNDYPHIWWVCSKTMWMPRGTSSTRWC